MFGYLESVIERAKLFHFHADVCCPVVMVKMNLRSMQISRHCIYSIKRGRPRLSFAFCSHKHLLDKNYTNLTLEMMSGCI